MPSCSKVALINMINNPVVLGNQSCRYGPGKVKFLCVLIIAFMNAPSVLPIDSIGLSEQLSSHVGMNWMFGFGCLAFEALQAEVQGPHEVCFRGQALCKSSELSVAESVDQLGFPKAFPEPIVLEMLSLLAFGFLLLLPVFAAPFVWVWFPEGTEHVLHMPCGRASWILRLCIARALAKEEATCNPLLASWQSPHGHF